MILKYDENTYGKRKDIISTTRVLVKCDECLKKEWWVFWCHRKAREHDCCQSCLNRMGIAGLKGKHQSEEAKMKIKKAMLGEKNPFYGRKHTEKTKQLISEKNKGISRNEGANNPMYGLPGTNLGKSFSQETIEKQRIVHRRENLSEETIQKLKLARQLQKHVYGNTSIEKKLQLALVKLGIPFETQKKLFGRPDIFIEPNICIFADGDYWHGLEKAKKRDPEVNEKLIKEGYIVLRFWEHDINDDVDTCLEKIKEFL